MQINLDIMKAVNYIMSFFFFLPKNIRLVVVGSAEIEFCEGRGRQTTKYSKNDQINKL